MNLSRSGKASAIGGALVTLVVGVTHWTADAATVAAATTLATFALSLVVKD
jgi:hypothetical protein